VNLRSVTVLLLTKKTSIAEEEWLMSWTAPVWIIIALVIAVFASVAAWINTQVIIKDLTEIKEKLGLSEKENKKSFFNHDLDND